VDNLVDDGGSKGGEQRNQRSFTALLIFASDIKKIKKQGITNISKIHY
jgi:hypothetical protein